MKKNKGIAPILILIGMLFLGTVGAVEYYASKNNFNNRDINNQINDQNLKEQKNTDNKTIIEEPSSDLDCEKIKNDIQQFDCYTKLANIKNNIDICKKIKPDWLIQDCYMDFAKKSGDYNVCLKPMIKFKDQCRFNIAAEKKDISVCPQLSSPWNDYCYRSIGVDKSDLSICKKISSLEEKDSCYEKIAIKNNDTSICKLINGNQDENGKSGCYLKIAVSKKDKKICNKIEKIEWVCLFISTAPDGSGGGGEYCEISKDMCYKAVEEGKINILPKS